MRKLIIAALLFVIALSGCNTEQPIEPTVTASPEPGDTPQPTDTPRPTSTPTETLTPTATFTPTKTPTPVPTATPAGYYENQGAAFSLIRPASWEVISEDSQGAVFLSDMGFFLFAFSEVTEEEATPEEIAAGILNGGFDAEFEISDRRQFTLRDGTETEELLLVFEIDGNEYEGYLLAPRRASRQYTFLLMGPRMLAPSQEGANTSFLSSISLQGDRLYGIDRDKALVVMGFDPDPEDLDPARTLSGAYGYTGLLFAGLVQLSPQLAIEPDLAESWSISPDGTVYTFVLREDARFENGKPITAEDVKYSWERAAQPDTESSTAGTYLGDILGIQAVIDGDSEEIEGLRVLDERTLEVTLDGPKPYFLIKLTYPTSFIVDREEVEADPENWMFSPNASGPYRLKELREEDAVIFVRSDAYYRPASIEYVIYLLFRPGTDISYYQAGEIDLAFISRADAEAIQAADHPLHDELHVSPSMCTSYIQFNNTLPPFDDINVRRAFSLAIDRDAINDIFFDGARPLANVILPQAMPGYTGELAPETFDPDAARDALAASAYAGDVPQVVVIEAGFGDSDDPFLNALISMWEDALDVDVVIEYVDPRDFAAALREAEGHINVGGWCADYPDPENFLDILFHTESGFNFANYSNPELDALLEEARTELDPAKRIALYQEIEALALADYAALPLFQSTSFVLVKPYLQGWVDSAMRVPIFDLLRIER